MHRRAVIAAASASLATGLAGCLGGPEEENGILRYGDDIEVPLLATSTAAEWHANEEATFFDARSRGPYESVRIAGAHWSPQPTGQDDDDPSMSLASDDRIVTYCRCPHTMSGDRAANLVNDGFSEVYVLDKGLNDWVDQGHPIEGENATANLRSADLGTPAYRDSE